MTALCIHGFRAEQCASCRPVRPAPAPESHSTQAHGGFEIYYVPAVTGWQFRLPDGAPSALSYRSAFLARKAIDALGGAPAAPRGRSRAKRGT